MSNNKTSVEDSQEHLMERHLGHNKRIYIYAILCALMCLILIATLAYRQLFLNLKYEKAGDIQSLRRVIQPGPRGNIYDRHGNIIVGNQPRFSAVAYLGELRSEFKKEYIKRVRDLRDQEIRINRGQVRQEARAFVLQKYLNHINTLLGRENDVDIKKLEKHFYQRLLLPLTLIEDLNYKEYAILLEKLPINYPIQVHTDTARYYPYGSAAAHTLGYVSTTLEAPREGVPGENLTTFSLKGKEGRSGLEKYFDDLLQGESGGEIWRVDPAGFQYEILESKSPRQGKHLTTSLDINLQIVAENALGSMIGAVIAMDVNSGEILSMVSKPSYDLNDLTPFIPQKTYDAITQSGGWLNRASQGLYPPGSPFKVITTIAGLRSGITDIDTTSNCQGTYLIGNRKFPCHSRYKWQGHGVIDAAEALKYSCNVFFFEHAQRMGHKPLTEESLRLGLGEQTGIELPYEARHMIVPDAEWKRSRGLGAWRGGDTSNMCIGQSYLMVTPLQVCCATASIARNETRTKPTLVFNNGKKVDHGGEPLGLTEDQHAFILDGMRRVAEEGTARKLSIPGLPIAAKSGTAQVKVKNGSLDVVWCVAFAPIEDPEIVVAVTIEEEMGDNFHGGATAAPVAREVLYEYFKDTL